MDLACGRPPGQICIVLWASQLVLLLPHMFYWCLRNGVVNIGTDYYQGLCRDHVANPHPCSLLSTSQLAGNHSLRQGPQCMICPKQHNFYRGYMGIMFLSCLLLTSKNLVLCFLWQVCVRTSKPLRIASSRRRILVGFSIRTTTT